MDKKEELLDYTKAIMAPSGLGIMSSPIFIIKYDDLCGGFMMLFIFTMLFIIAWTRYKYIEWRYQ